MQMYNHLPYVYGKVKSQFWALAPPLPHISPTLVTENTSISQELNIPQSLEIQYMKNNSFFSFLACVSPHLLSIFIVLLFYHLSSFIHISLLFHYTKLSAKHFSTFKMFLVSALIYSGILPRVL